MTERTRLRGEPRFENSALPLVLQQRASLVGAVFVHGRLPLLLLALAVFSTIGFSRAATAEDSDPSVFGDLTTRAHLLPDWGGVRTRLEQADVLFDIAHTGDFVANTRGGLARESEFLGNLDMTLTWRTATLLERDYGTFFVYGIWDHGGSPSSHVGDAQGVDNIEAPHAAKIFEAWWQKSLFDGRGSILFGLYDVNSEFYAVDSGEVFLHSSFGMGGELGTSGRNGPSIFPTASLGARIKVEPFAGYQVQAAVLDGVPGVPDQPKSQRIRLGDDDGAFVIVEVTHHRSSSIQPDDDSSRSAARRRVGRIGSEHPKFATLALGSWMYTARQSHVSRTDANGDPSEVRGHPGLYLTADFDARNLESMSTRGPSVFVQLGWADGSVGQFVGYTGAGLKYVGLIPFRPADECGFAVAAAYNGRAFERASRAKGDAPAVAEIALEWTYRAALAPWITLQGDLQYIVNPGALRDRPDAVVVGFRYVVDL